MAKLLYLSLNIIVLCTSVLCANIKRAVVYPEREGRHLLIRRVPAVEEFQSDIYEVYAKPYNYDLHRIVAISVLKSEDISGEITFTQLPAGPVHIEGNITGLTPGKHGLHIHHSGDLRNGCEKLGPHFNPYFVEIANWEIEARRAEVSYVYRDLKNHLQFAHGGPLDPLRHVGDIGNIEAGEDGTAKINIIDNFVQLTGYPRGVVGRAVVITSNQDDYGRGGDANSLVDGNSGKPLVCGVIAYTK